MTETETTISRLQADLKKLNHALMPFRSRYQVKEREDLLKMEPLDELPDILIPGAIPRALRRPPLLRRGYPITRAALERLLEERYHGHTIPWSTDDSFLGVRLHVLEEITLHVGYPLGVLRCRSVFGLVDDGAGAIIIEVAHNYDVKSELPQDIQKQLGKLLGVEGPPKWYLDDCLGQWDWETLLPGWTPDY